MIFPFRLPLWIPAFAGMTGVVRGMTGVLHGMMWVLVLHVIPSGARNLPPFAERKGVRGMFAC